MPQPVQNQQVPQSSTTPKSNPLPSKNEPDAFAQLAEAVVSAQAYLNNPKAEKTSTRREPVNLVPDPNAPLCGSGRNLSRAESREPRQKLHNEKSAPASSSSLPLARRGGKAAFSSCGTGSQPVHAHSARSAASSSRATGHASRATTHRPVSTVRQAKNYLRASRSPQFLRSTPDFQRHRRKCAICKHPEREMIEELFIHWHSPAAIANFFRDYEEINWVSIYRHAYALGLDQIRRRNLHHFFENLLDDAIEATPTFAGVLGAARALACVTEDGLWVEPEKRITMTTVVRKEDPATSTSTDPGSSTRSVDPVEDPEHSRRERSRMGQPVHGNFALAPSSSPPQAAVDHSARSASVVGAGLACPDVGRALPAPAKQASRQDSFSSSSLPNAAPDDKETSPTAALSRSGLQPRQIARLNGASSRERLEGRGPSSTPPRAASRSCLPVEESAPAPASTQSQAVPNQPARSAVSFPRVTGHAPRNTNRVPASSSSGEIRLSPNSHKTKEKTISNR